MLSAAGPTQGHVRRPTDGKPPRGAWPSSSASARAIPAATTTIAPRSAAWPPPRRPSWPRSTSRAWNITIFFLDLRAFGKDFDRYCDRAQETSWACATSARSSPGLYEMPDNRNLRLVYAGAGTQGPVEEEFDLVVLSLGLEPGASLQAQAERLGVVLNRWGFAQTDEFRPMDTWGPRASSWAGPSRSPRTYPIR